MNESATAATVYLLLGVAVHAAILGTHFSWVSIPLVLFWPVGMMIPLTGFILCFGIVTFFYILFSCCVNHV